MSVTIGPAEHLRKADLTTKKQYATAQGLVEGKFQGYLPEVNTAEFIRAGKEKETAREVKMTKDSISPNFIFNGRWFVRINRESEFKAVLMSEVK